MVPSVIIEEALPTMSSGNHDDDAASNIQQNLLKEAYSAAACSLADLQCSLDGMDEALVSEARHRPHPLTNCNNRRRCEALTKGAGT